MHPLVKQLALTVASHHVRRRLPRFVPVLGAAFAAYAIIQRIRAKGWGRGSLDAALDLTPIVGQVKAVYELFAGDVIAPARAH